MPPEDVNFLGRLQKRLRKSTVEKPLAEQVAHQKRGSLKHGDWVILLDIFYFFGFLLLLA